MKKKLFHILGCIFLFICISSCGPQEKDGHIVENHTTYEEKTTKGKNNYKYMTLKREQMDSIMAIYDNNLIYEKYIEDSKISYFYRFDMSKNITYQLGSLKNATVNSGSICQIDDKFYFYINTMDWKTETETCNLCKIDLSNNTFKVIQSELADQSLVYVDVLSGKLLSYKGRGDEQQATTFLEEMNTKDLKKKELITTNLDSKSNTGEMIHNFCQTEGAIYTIGDDTKGENRVYFMKKYNEKGEYIKTITIGSDISKIFDNVMIRTFEVIGNYAFIADFSDKGILCDISSEVAIPKIIGDEFKVSLKVNNEKLKKDFILTNREAKEIWIFHTENCTLSKLDLYVEGDYLSNTMINEGTKIIVFMGENIHIVDYKDIPIKQTIEMTEELIEFYNFSE